MIKIDNNDIANYIIKNKTTVRECGNHFGVSKSTIHQRIQKLPIQKRTEVQKILDINFADKSSRGGISLHNKYRELLKGDLKCKN